MISWCSYSTELLQNIILGEERTKGWHK